MATADNILTEVYVLVIVNIHLHQPDQHPRQNTQEVQVSSCLTHLTKDIRTKGKACKYSIYSISESMSLSKRKKSRKYLWGSTEQQPARVKVVTSSFSAIAAVHVERARDRPLAIIQ